MPFEDASPRECCEVVWHIVGKDVTPDALAALDDAKIAEPAKSFGEDFECESPTLKNSETQSLTHWRGGLLALWMNQRLNPLQGRQTWFCASRFAITFCTAGLDPS